MDRPETDEQGNLILRGLRIGERFGCMTVIAYTKKGQANTDCRCTCGQVTPCSVEGLLLGHFNTPCCHIVLRGEDSRRFVEALLDPPEPGEHLIQAMRTHLVPKESI